MTRTNYIFVDWENVQDHDLDRLDGKPAFLTLILGKEHRALPVALVKKLIRHASQVELVETGRSGKNALDMVLASHVGARIAADPGGFFHIVAKDRDYQSLVGHYNDNDRLAHQHTSLAEIPILMNHGERLTYLQNRYRSAQLSKPRNRTKLETQVQIQFAQSLSAEELEKLIQAMISSKLIHITSKNEVLFLPE